MALLFQIGKSVNGSTFSKYEAVVTSMQNVFKSKIRKRMQTPVEQFHYTRIVFLQKNRCLPPFCCQKYQNVPK